MRHPRQGANGSDRVGDDFLDRSTVVLNSVHEGAIGAVLQQVDAAADAYGMVFDDLLIQRLAHAMQALELKVAPIAGEFQHRRDRVRVVRGELWIEQRGLIK